MAKPTKRIALAAGFLGLLVLACGGGANQEATVQALSRSISGTATAAAAAGGSEAGGLVETAQAGATEQAGALRGTAEAELGASDLAQAATATAAAPLLSSLPDYGVDPSQGELAWVHPPITVDVSGYLQSDFENQFLGTVARDFVMSSDITWNTTTGLSACGFVFRSNGEEDSLDQYMGLVSRGGNGRVIYQVMIDGEVENAINMYAAEKDPFFQWRNDTTNNLTVVVRGKTFSFYTNGNMIDEVQSDDPPSPPFFPPPPPEPPEDAPPDAQAEYEQALEEHEEQVERIRGEYNTRVAANREGLPYLDRGFVAMVAVSESGRTICQFENTWLWLFDEPVNVGGS